MFLIWCENCEHYHGQTIEIPNKNTGITDKYCESCLPEEYKELLKKYKEENPTENREK